MKPKKKLPYVGTIPTGKLVGLPPNAKSPCDYEEIPMEFVSCSTPRTRTNRKKGT